MPASPVVTGRLRALTMPAVTVELSPSGEPKATTLVADAQRLRRRRARRAAALGASFDVEHGEVVDRAAADDRGRRSGCRPGRRSRSGRRRSAASATTWLLVMTWPWRSSTKPEPVAPPFLPSYSATICTVLGSSCLRHRGDRAVVGRQRRRRDGVDAVEAAADACRAVVAASCQLLVDDAAERRRRPGRRPAPARRRPARPSRARRPRGRGAAGRGDAAAAGCRAAGSRAGGRAAAAAWAATRRRRRAAPAGAAAPGGRRERTGAVASASAWSLGPVRLVAVAGSSAGAPVTALVGRSRPICTRPRRGVGGEARRVGPDAGEPADRPTAVVARSVGGHDRVGGRGPVDGAGASAGATPRASTPITAAPDGAAADARPGRWCGATGGRSRCSAR